MAWNPVSLNNLVDNKEENDRTKQWATFNRASNGSNNASADTWETLNRFAGGNSNTTAMMNPETGILGNLLGSYGKDGKQFTGWGSPAVNLGKGLYDSWLSWKTLGLAEDTFESNKELAWANYNAQKNTTNASLQWLEDSRNAFNGPGTSDLSQYMIS